MNVHDFSKVHMILKERIGRCGDAPGAVLLVRFQEDLVFHEAYGYRQIVPHELPITKNTLFDLASLSKSIGTALAVMQLWCGEKIDLNAKIGFYRKEIKDTDKDGISIRHLLTNTSGLPSWRPYFREVVKEETLVDATEIFKRILQEPLEAPIGTQEIYSDLGFILLGCILEGITGGTLDVLFSRLLFKPLGLRHTGFRKIPQGQYKETIEPNNPIASTEWCSWRGRMLTGEVHDENCYVMGMVAGHAGLFSTSEELDRIVFELMKGYQGDSRIFSKKAVRTFLKRQDIVKDGSWALGWDTPCATGSSAGIYFSENSFGHNGFTGTSIWIDMDQGVAVIFLTNRVHPTRERQGIKILRPEIHNAVMESLGLDLHCSITSKIH